MLNQLTHDDSSMSWYHITTSYFEGFFDARLTKTPRQRKSPAESRGRQKPTFDRVLVDSQLLCN